MRSTNIQGNFFLKLFCVNQIFFRKEHKILKVILLTVRLEHTPYMEYLICITLKSNTNNVFQLRNVYFVKKLYVSEVGFEPTPGEPDCDLNAAP